MDSKVAKAGLFYVDVAQAIREVCAAWGVACSDADARNMVNRSRLVAVIITGMEAEGAKKEAVYREIGDEIGLSRHTVESIARGRR